MRAFVTGATGFIGGRLARALVARGDEITVLARDPARAAALASLPGVRVVRGDVTDRASLDAALGGHDAVFHLAAWYALGIRDRALMERINVGGTENVLSAASEAGIPRIVHCSTVAALGREKPGAVADEDVPNPGVYGSVYEETKHAAHEIVLRFAREGAPVVLCMPGATYGPGDHSMVGVLLRLYARRILVACPFLDTGLSWVNVDDVAEGFVRAHDKGRAGEAYILGGDNETIAGMFRRIAPHTGIRAPMRLPDWTLGAARPFGPLIAKALGQQPGLIDEGMTSLHGSWMFSSAKAERELGYSFRPIEDGVVATVKELRAR